MNKLISATALSALLAAATIPAAEAAPARYDHVLLLSIAGLHGQDLARFIAAAPESALAGLARHGTVYDHATTTKPSDSFPGFLSLITGGTPASTGIWYDDFWSRSLSPAGSDCKTTGAAAVFDEAVDINADAPDAGGGIDEKKLPRDPLHGCKPVYPHAALGTNTVFDVVHAAGRTGAWADKHPSYEIAQGRGGNALDDFFAPEIAAKEQDHDVTTAIANDGLRVSAIANQIRGLDHAGSRKIAVPAVFGMNFEAVSVGQKYVGYADAAGTPSAGITQALQATDRAIGGLLADLKTAHLDRRTLVIVAAKHGQAPIDRAKLRKIDGKALKAAIEAAAPGSVAYTTLDDVGLVWLKDRGASAAAVQALDAHKDELGIAKVYAGEAIRTGWHVDPASDDRAPDLLVEVQPGVIYTKPTNKKVAEHGGFGDEDTSVALLVAAGGNGRHVAAPVATTQVAPTILAALGLDPRQLDAVRAEGTSVLPGLGLPTKR